MPVNVNNFTSIEATNALFKTLMKHGLANYRLVNLFSWPCVAKSFL